MSSRQVGDYSHGNENELNIVDVLKNKRYKDLNLNLKSFISYVCEHKGIKLGDTTTIDAKYETNTKLKQDFYLYVDDVKIYISVKMGSGNSVHQEKCEDFIDYIKENFNANDEICNAWRLFLWADGTFDGSGSIEKDADGIIKTRFTATQFKTLYPQERRVLQTFLNENKRELIEHFLFIGRHNSKVDFIYHGTPQHGSWIYKDKIVDYQVDNELSLNQNNRSCLTVGKMTVQSWNISKKGTSEGKRGQLQVKYGRISEDLYNLMLLEKSNIGTVEGDAQEFDLSKVLNKDKKNKM